MGFKGVFIARTCFPDVSRASCVFFLVWRLDYIKLFQFLVHVPILNKKKKKKKKKKKEKKRNNRPPRIFEFKGKTLIILGVLLYDSSSWDIRVYHAKTDFHFDKN